MNWEEALSEIESYEFNARLNVVSSMPAFFRAAAQEPAVLELYGRMPESGDVREEALGRIHDLSRLEVDRRYENPNDTPLAILLWLTWFAAPDYAGIAADLVDRAPQCWYAKKLARRILIPPSVASGNSWVGERPPFGDSGYVFAGDITLTLNPVTPEVKHFHHQKLNATALTAGDAGEAQTRYTTTVGDQIVG